MSECISKTEPLVSVIVPVYNVGKYLERCVESLLLQTYSSFEIILVDDGSTDNSGALCDSIQRRDARIIVIHKQNGGSSDARNAGIKQASGKYVVFCDSDDTVEPDWIEEMVRAAMSHPNSLVLCGYFICDDQGETRRVVCAPEGEYTKEQYYDLFEQTGSVCIKIFRQEVLKEKSLHFDETVRYSEDTLFSIDYLDQMESFYAINKPLYHYYHFGPENRETNSSHITYAQMKLIYDVRVSRIAEKDIPVYQKRYFGNIWARFNALTSLKSAKAKEVREEAKAIINDPVFQEYLKNQGEELFDSRSRKLLEKGRVNGYIMLQKAAAFKRKLAGK